jgi:hypothetical protein
MSYYYYPIFEDELKRLEHDLKLGKVNHPLGGSKDVADAVCGAAYGVVTSKASMPQDPVVEKTAPAKKTVEEETLKGIVSDYPDSDKVTSILPPPQSEPKPRQLRTGRANWADQLEGFGRHRRRT